MKFSSTSCWPGVTFGLNTCSMLTYLHTSTYTLTYATPDWRHCGPPGAEVLARKFSSKFVAHIILYTND